MKDEPDRDLLTDHWGNQANEVRKDRSILLAKENSF